MQKLIYILICYLCANAALGGVIVSSPDSGWYNRDGLEGKEFRGDEATGNIDFSKGDWVVGLGIHDEMINGRQGCLDRGGSVTLYPDIIRLEGLPDTSPAYLAMLNTTLDAEASADDSFDEIVAGYRENADLQYAHINNSDELLSDIDFVLEGALHIDWTGTVLIEEETGMNVTMSQIPEPASIIMVIMNSAN